MTPDQEKAILEMLEDHRRARWAWNSIAIVAKWMSTVVGGVLAFYAAWKYMITDFVSGRPG